jgi:hypothetical protein
MLCYATISRSKKEIPNNGMLESIERRVVDFVDERIDEAMTTIIEVRAFLMLHFFLLQSRVAFLKE